MKVHHLNCGTMHPLGAPEIVCHVLLVETDNGLVLVDTGHGLHDCADPAGRVGPMRFLFRTKLDPSETAARQIEALGFNRNDVRHIVVTHFDMDHIGGISDFPDAQIHVTAAEVYGAMRAPTRPEKFRFRELQWAHGPKIVEHNPDGEKWRGFAAAKELADIAPGIALISLPGHTRGHACVAVDGGSRWILHCGDAFYEHGVLDGHSKTSLALRAFETVAAFEPRQVRKNHARLAELYLRQEPDLFIISAHDPDLFKQAKATA